MISDEKDYYNILALPPLRRCDAGTEDKNKTGIEVLKEQNFRCLEGKRVGLITNPTGVDNRMKSTIDILHEAPNVNLWHSMAPNTAYAVMCTQATM